MLRIFLSLWLAFAPSFAWAGSMTLLGAGKAPSSGGACSQATTFLARTTLTGTDATNYTTLICAWVSNGTISGDLLTTGCGLTPPLFDAIYIFATHDATNALLNICGTNYTALNASGLTFTAYSGFTGISGTAFLSTQFNPTTAISPNFVQNSAHLSIWNLTNGTNGVPSVSDDGGTSNNIFSKYTDNNIYARVNDGGSAGFSITDPRGLLLGNRSSSTARQLYQNASTTLLGGTTATYGSVPSSAPANNNIELLGNTAGGGAVGNTLAGASIGASLTSTQVTNFYTPLRTYMTAVGVP